MNFAHLQYLTKISQEKGAVLVEFTFGFIFLVFLSLLTVTMGESFIRYLKFVQIADEAVRTLAAVPTLLSDTPVQWTDITNQQRADCSVGTGRGNTICGHLLAQTRVRLLSTQLGIDPNLLKIESLYETTKDTVSINISQEQNELFSFIGNLPINVTAEGPYLF